LLRLQQRFHPAEPVDRRPVGLADRNNLILVRFLLGDARRLGFLFQRRELF
jgi:hypothetical protein